VDMWSSYSDAELELILDFLTRVGEVMRRKQSVFRQATRHPAPARGRTNGARKAARLAAP
ncbi:MAG: hypothetical protein ACREE3_13500, partial [Stellaceae bacterium]